MSLPPDLAEIQVRIRRVAAGYGLDFFETVFEMVDWDEMNTIASYEGFPVRYPHWRWGMHYDQISKNHKWGLSKIYELVINNDPCYAYLLKGNSTVDQKLVMAHVYAHCDFFKNNLWFGPTNRRMVDELASHASRIQRHIEREGQETVEAFLDSCLSVENLIDIYAPYGPPRGKRTDPDERADQKQIVRFDAKPYMESFINPPEFIEEQRREQEEQRLQPPAFPERPERDVLWFLMDHSSLRSWQRDVLAMVREEAYYFAPQRLTKIMNEGWACLVAGSRIFTDHGLLPVEELVHERMSVKVNDGETGRAVRDWASFEERETVRLRTRRGLVVEGSTTHRVLLPDGGWMTLGDAQVGARVALDAGANLWPRKKLRLRREVDEGAGRAMAGGGTTTRTRVTAARFPTVVDDDLAALMGDLVARGSVECGVRLVTPDATQAERFAARLLALFGVGAKPHRSGGMHEVVVDSPAIAGFLDHLGCSGGSLPEPILRSPRTVVVAFLRAYFDGAAELDGNGIVVAGRGRELARLVQVLLVNFGILSERKAGTLRIGGRSAARFRDQVGFSLARAGAALDRYLDGHWFAEEEYADQVVSVRRGRREAVFDMSVETTHRYAAGGLIHHNSYWHSKMMTEKLVDPSEIIDFAERHAGAMAMSGTKVNPYKLGIELYRDVEDRWNRGRFGKEFDECDDLTAKRKWDTGLQQGHEKIFEVRRIYNDMAFVDEFLTPDFCERAKLFTYDFNPKTGRKEISGRDFREVKDRLLRSLANGGQPIIEVVDANFRNRGELVLQHRHDGEDLKLDWAQETLKHLFALWTRPVHINTLLENEPKQLSFDGESLTQV